MGPPIGPDKGRSSGHSHPVVVRWFDTDSPASPPPTEQDPPPPPAPKRPLVQDPEGWIKALKRSRPGRINSPPSTTPVLNRFAPLAGASTSTSQNIPPPPQPKVARPPPIILDTLDIAPSRLATAFRAKGVKDFRIQNTQRGLKIFLALQADFEVVTAFLKSTHETAHPVSFYTYAPKGSKPNQKFLLLGLDEDHPLDAIRSAIAHPDLIDVRRLTTMRDGVKHDTPNVLVTFQPHYKYEAHLKSIRTIDNIMIRHKPFNANKAQPSCGNCQAIGHTKRYCWRPKRCLRCSGNHSVQECSPEAPIKCANCGEAHPASSRQCPNRVRLLRKVQASRSQPDAPRTVPRHPPPPPPSVWGPPLQTSTPASHVLFPNAFPRPPTTPSGGVPPTPHHAPTPTNPDTAPAWVTDLTTTLTTVMNTIVNMMQTLLTTLPRMLAK